MKCPYCASEDTKVVDSRVAAEGQSIRRRRECCTCHERFTTLEQVIEAPWWVLKKDGSREPYERRKIREGLARACYKSSIADAEIQSIVDRVENSAFGPGRAVVRSHELGTLIMAELKERDQVAYVRFASVHREFREVSDLAQALGPMLSVADNLHTKITAS